MVEQGSYQLLFQPGRMGPLILKNRLVMTAMSTGFAGAGGQASNRLTEYYATRASGGAALITVEEAYIHPQLPHIINALGIYGDHLIAGLQNLTRRIHQEKALAALQIGLYFRQQLNGFPRYAVSAHAPDCGADGCKELTAEEIQYLIKLFTDAAERACQAGFDAVEIHACHGCLISEFLSPFWNKRSDGYGGDRAGRFRLALEILSAIRRRLGPDYCVLYRISGSEFTSEGFTTEDAVELSKALEAEGVSAINVSGGLGHVNHIAIPPCDVPRGLLLPIGKQIKAAVKVPVIVGNSMTPDLAKNGIETDAADFIGLGRPLIADPQWPVKVEQGRLDEIRHCLRCNQGCFGAIRDPRRTGISCMYNPLSGREFERPITPAEKKLRLVVVGGGPAGCETARIARLRGHDVILLEKTDRLGGQIRLAAAPPQKADFNKMIEFYEGELKRLGVDLRLKTEADSGLLKSLDADVYVFATGASPGNLSLPGAELSHVVTARAVLAGWVDISKGPVVVIGGGATGLETADFLSEKGLGVAVVEMLDSAGRDIVEGIGVREALLNRLAFKKVRIYVGNRVTQILADAVVVSNRPLIGGGDEIRIPAESVVLAIGMIPEPIVALPELPDNAKWYQVGDCANPGNAFGAIQQAFELSRKI
jgi:2,4-dienoyl-CoA reductase-like NADH-dependent reductase (Old Yellow Enzyme family)/NADPH-dependent 2,4-dienoyl-CoA reductase/sulfur reductase-like enzyme